LRTSLLWLTPIEVHQTAHLSLPFVDELVSLALYSPVATGGFGGLSPQTKLQAP